MLPFPHRVVRVWKEGESRAKKSATLKRTFECGRIAKMSLEDEEMEDEEYESDFEESGSDVSDEEDF